jgi:hypothetical protein
MARVICKPNISASGRRRRSIFGIANVALGVALLAALIVLKWPFYLRATVFVPAAMAAIGFLQAMRNTCVARAKEGTFENDDFSTVRASDDDVAASRKVAAGIMRDALLIGLACALLAAASALVV